VSPRLLLALALVGACARSAANHEELGDRAYAAAGYPDALAEYQLGLKASPGNASLHAKAAAAASHTGDNMLAATEYRALAQADRSRADEAAQGLERVARAALAGGDRVALAAALQGIREIAPNRPLGRYARLAALDAADNGDTVAAMTLLPVAVASATDGATEDSLLYAYGRAAVRVRQCAIAVPVFEGVIRRQRQAAVLDGAREGLGLCALLEGQQALDKGQPGVAGDWFRRASAPGAAPDVVRAAYLGLGDVLLAQGDMTGALNSYQQALAGGSPGDSITVKAQAKINALGRAADSTSPPKP
jgi:predicted negative regulator of RcsB-dependent stress response